MSDSQALRKRLHPDEWKNYPFKDLEFEIELWTDSEFNQYITADAYDIVGGGPLTKLEVYSELPALQERIAELLADPSTKRCCVSTTGSTDCYDCGTICPLFRFKDTSEGSTYWIRRAPHLHVIAYATRT